MTEEEEKLMARRAAGILAVFNTIPDIMRYLDEHMMIRYDPEREENKFTVTFRGTRLGDTDDPYMLLLEYVLGVIDNRRKAQDASK